jgi:hypothetical protein
LTSSECAVVATTYRATMNRKDGGRRDAKPRPIAQATATRSALMPMEESPEANGRNL